ncbi:efflux RND transporter periplasmic adaptor subunit [Schlesneria sp. DSM 10557]|uniref:efflux RND transporter periplasmic adaptor subunit n=1 Tax=Schlesneria sp. DSM 10557 TaxID=3044399 RepID=UPI0035A0D405
MNILHFVRNRPIITLLLAVAILVAGGMGLSASGVELKSVVDTANLHALSERVESLFPKHEEEHHEETHRIVATTPQSTSVTITQQYVCQIHSQRHIQVRALERGYLEAIPVKEGQTVKAGDLMFKVMPVLYQARLEAELAEAHLAQLEYNFSKKLFEDKVVSQNEVALNLAKVKKTEAKVKQAQAELNFATVKAPFDGIVDRLQHQQGSLVEEGECLTTLSDNSLMWVYFNVPEARYLEYMAELRQNQDDLQVELVLADGSKFPQVGRIGAIEADFNNQTGNIPFRADFPNPDRLLRHGQTGNILIHRVVTDAIVIPQRATFEILNKRYVFVVDQDDVAHQREIAIENELEDIFVLKKGLNVDEKIVLEGVRQVRDGDKVEYDALHSDQVVANLKYHAE